MFRTTSSINSSESNVIKTSCTGNDENPAAYEPWGEHTFPSPVSLGLISFIASIHAESFHKDAAITLLAADVFSVGSYSAVT